MDDAPIIELEEREDCWISRSPYSDRVLSATVVIPTYDARETLRRAVRSALDQTIRDIEVIVVDDASTDSSWAMISSWLRQDPRLRAIRHKRNGGKSAAVNRASRIARGRWLAVLDADDWYSPDRLAELTGLGESHQADLVADNQFLHDAGAAQVVGTAWPEATTVWKLGFDDFLSGLNAYETFNLGMLKPVIRMDYVRQKSLAYEERLRQGEDFIYLLQFYLAGGSVVISDTPHYNYTQPFGSISRQWSHAARRRYDFQSAYNINRLYLESQATRLTPAQNARLKKYNGRLKSLEHYHRSKECLERRDLLGVVNHMVRHPAVLGHALRRLRYRIVPLPPSTTIERLARQARRRPGRDFGEQRHG